MIFFYYDLHDEISVFGCLRLSLDWSSEQMDMCAAVLCSSVVNTTLGDNGYPAVYYVQCFNVIHLPWR